MVTKSLIYVTKIEEPELSELSELIKLPEQYNTVIDRFQVKSDLVLTSYILTEKPHALNEERDKFFLQLS